MKSAIFITVTVLISLGSYPRLLRAQSCLNCWINPKTGQQESLERIIPPQASPPPVVSSPPPPPTEGEKPAPKAPKPPEIPLLDDPLDQVPPDPQPLPRTQVDPRSRQGQ